MSALQLIDGHAKKDLSITLATETLAEIFISGVSLMDFDMDDGGFQKTFMNPKAIPLSVSQVCRRWRQITHSIPFLWSKIRFGASQQHIPMDAIAAWIERSRDHPLDVEHVYHGSRKSGAFLKLIAFHCERWRSFKIEAESKSSWVHLLHSIRGRLPLLSSLVIKSGVSDCFIFEEAPRLTRVVLILDPRRSEAINVALPWAQLTHYEGVGYYETLEMLAVLFYMPNIRVFKVFGEMPMSFADSDVNDPPAVLRNLNEMYMSASPIEGVLSYTVSAPNLRSLSACIVLHEVEPDEEVLSLISFIKRSSCVLDKLTLAVSYRGNDDGVDPSANIVELLRQCSSVETLELKVKDYPPSLCGIINALARNDKLNGVVLPKLRHLKFCQVVCPKTPSQDVALALTSMLHARQALSVTEKLPIIEVVHITMDIAPPAGTCADLWKGISDKRPSMVWKVERVGKIDFDEDVFPPPVLTSDSDGSTSGIENEENED